MWTNFKRSAVGNEIYCFVPLHMLFPALRDVPLLYLGLGQRLVLNLRLVPAGECMLSAPDDAAGGDPTYVV
jgi:hypothetical protein